MLVCVPPLEPVPVRILRRVLSDLPSTTMSNLALETAGAEVVTASTIDPRHPPACVIDGYVHARGPCLWLSYARLAAGVGGRHSPVA